jgi:hypothetical protein
MGDTLHVVSKKIGFGNLLAIVLRTIIGVPILGKGEHFSAKLLIHVQGDSYNNIDQQNQSQRSKM